MQRPVPKGPPSQSNIVSQFDAIKSAQSTAISSNEKIFPIFVRKLVSKDSRDYANTVQKLATWLSSERAYYPVARPKIVELLEVALAAFTETYMQHPTVVELAQQLRQLIRAVTQFKHMFSEAELQSRLQRVVIETDQCLSRVPQSPARTLYQLPATAGPPPPLLTSMAYSQSGVTAPDPQGLTGQIGPTLSIPSVMTTVSDSSGFVYVPQAPNSSETVPSAQVETVASGTIPVSNNLQALDDSASSGVVSKPLPKRVRRADIPQELVARDLDYFKSTQSQTVTTVKEDPGASSPNLGGSSSPALASDFGRSPPPRKKTARMVPSRHLPRRISLEAPGGAVPGIPASVLPYASEPLTETGGSIAVLMDVDGASPSLEKAEHDATPAEIPTTYEAKENSQHEGLQYLGPPVVATSTNEQLADQEVQMAHQSSSADAPLLNGEAHVSTAPPAPLPEAVPNGIDSMDSATSNSGPHDLPSDPPSKVETLDQLSPQMLGFPDPVLPPLVNALEPPLNRNFRMAGTSSPYLSSESETKDMGQQRFDETMTVIHGTRGKPFTHTHLIEIDLNESTFSKISMWVNRRSYPSQASRGVCISLVCYHLPQLFDAIKPGSEKKEVEGLVSQLACSWPGSGRLSLHVIRDGDGKRRETVVPLSPPFFLTPDRCVDISSLLTRGTNSLRIQQQDDLSEYMLVLLAHRPTSAQLAQVAEVRDKDEQWERFLDALCRPVVVPTRSGEV